MTAPVVSASGASAAIRARLASFRSKPYAELRALANVREELKVDGVEATLSLFREEQSDGHIWVIGQLVTADKPLLGVFKSHQQFVEGFEVRSDGSSRDLSAEELYGYD